MKHPLDKQVPDIGVWRYGIISALLHQHPDDGPLYLKLESLAARIYYHPDGRQIHYSEETLRKWLYRFRQGGLPALSDNPRVDKGTHQIPEAITEALFALRDKHPRWTVSRMLDQLVKDLLWNKRIPSSSSLYRYAREHNLGRDPHLKTERSPRPFEFTNFGQMWTADFMHGPRLWVNKRKRKTYLHAIIDDASRYVVSAGFYLAENVQNLICELMRCVRKFGICQRLYTDNGASYSSRHLKIVCARLSIHLHHTPPYKPQGRGKIERFFRTVRDQFLATDRSKTPQQINKAFNQWLADYHHNIHSALKCSPLQKRMQIESMCKIVPEVTDIDALFRTEKRCRVYNDGTIHLLKKRFEVPDYLPGDRVTVYYLPWNLSQIYYGDEMKPARLLDTVANAHRFDHPN
jgi:putative transposase